MFKHWYFTIQMQMQLQQHGLRELTKKNRHKFLCYTVSEEKKLQNLQLKIT